MLAFTAHRTFAFVATLRQHLALGGPVAFVGVTRVVGIGTGRACREEEEEERKEANKTQREVGWKEKQNRVNTIPLYI